MEEFLPVVAGLLCGLVLGTATARRRLAIGIAFSILAGVTATVVSGEWRISWAYLLIDIPLVAVSAVVGVVASRSLVLRRTGR